MVFNFKKREEPIYTNDFWYDLFDGGYLDPHKLLEEKLEADRVVLAMGVVREFIQDAFDQDILEVL